MKFRRMVEHLQGQHWTAIFIDLVIVVVGVFIGIQVSNWNGDRAERQQNEVAKNALALINAELAKKD